MNLPTNYFVINLAHRLDRLKSFQEKTKDFPFDISVSRGICGDICKPPDNWTAGNGAWGCYKSHLNILEQCLNDGIGSYVVFEDDAQFKPNFLDVFQNTFKHVPDDWDQIYFGGQLIHQDSRPPIKLNDYIYRPFNVNRTHCFALSRSGMEKVYRYISLLPFHRGEHIDHHLGRWHEDFDNKVYCPPVWTVGQHGSSSSVSGKNEPVQFYDDPCGLTRDHWLYHKPACVLFKCTAKLKSQLSSYLHFGNSITPNGYDTSLEDAFKFKAVNGRITQWYNWIRSECVGTDRIPAAYHPMIDISLLKLSGVKHILTLEHCTLEEAIQKIREFRESL